MSFIKGVITFIVTSILGFGGVSTQVYVAPTETVKNTVISSSTKTVIATSTKEISTTTKKSEVVVKKQTATTTKTTLPKNEVKKEEPKPAQEIPLPDFEKVNTEARKTIVNILCSTKANELSPSSGTGVMINGKGIILTNAHIAQYFLLKDWGGKDNVNCIIRTGSPAYPKYKAELVYISPTWIKNNTKVLKSENPTGTGEYDFAFLRITEGINGDKLPDGFFHILPDIREGVEKNEPVLLISYPAGFLGGLSILKDLNVTSSMTTIQDVFTFKEKTIDLISVGGTVISQKGSSGGAVVDKYISLLGIISTSSDGDTTDKRDLRAITLAHINRSLQEELGINLSAFLYQDLAEFSKTFSSTTAPVLTKLLIDSINN